MEVHEGERFLIFGENGAGKTTLLRVLSTAIAASRGELEIFGLDPGRHPQEVRRGLALMTHLPALYEDLSGVDNLDIVSHLVGSTPDSTRWLDMVGLDVRPDPVRTWSAGMRKRLSFARVLAQEPRLALLDEPYGQLDPEGARMVDGLLGVLSAQGCTVIMASHMVERAAALCDNALLLRAGLPRWQGPASDAPRAWAALRRAREAGAA